MNRPKAMPYFVFFLLGCVAAMLWQGFKNEYYFRPVQRLISRDGDHTAILSRSDAFLDLNFRINLDGQNIYRSPDFKPNRSLSFRETLVWDVTGKILIFEVLGRRLFGYDLIRQQPLTSVELLHTKESPISAREAGFEGQWPQ